MLRVVVLLLSLWTGIEGVINFKHSQLFDEFDLRASAKIPLRCTEGCYVYASLRETVDEQFESNIAIRDDNGRVSHSLREIGRSYDVEKQMQKKVFELPTANGNYSIVRTGGNLADTQPVAIYVLFKDYFDTHKPSLPPVFEPRIQQSASVSAEKVVFLSAEPFTLTRLQLEMKHRLNVFTTGPDTMIGERWDSCGALYYSEESDTSGLILPFRSPIVTVSTGYEQSINFSVSPKLEPVKLTNWTKTVITSPGYIGCEDLKNSGEIFHWRDAETSTNQTLVNDAVQTIFVEYNVNTTGPLVLTGDHFLRLTGQHNADTQFHSSSLKVEWTKTNAVDEYFSVSIRLDGSAPTPSTPPPPKFNFTTCGQTPVQPNLSSERIEGGQTAVPYSWPWQVVWCQSGWYGGCRLECGGTIIANQWIMTAGFCVFTDMNPKNYQVKAGVYIEDSTTESGEQIANVKAIHLHPDFYFDGDAKTDDIALIELATPLKYTEHVMPICLPTEDTAAIAKPNSAYVTGWGRTTKEGDWSLQLRQAKVPLVDYPTCENQHPGKIRENTMVCTGVASCEGDNGGPMVVQGASGKWFQVGIDSWGNDECSEKDASGVYSRVTGFCDYISATTSGKVSCQPIA